MVGDAHVRNLGAFAAPDGRLVFDINDFDEAIRGPFEWDLKRMAASLVLAGRASGHKDGAARSKASGWRMLSAIAAHDARLCQNADARGRAIPGASAGNGTGRSHAALTKAERATPLHTLESLTEPEGGVEGEPRHFKVEPDADARLRCNRLRLSLASLVPYRAMLEPQRQHLLSMYRPIDVAFKVVGTGSVGLRDYCVYFEGNGPGDPLFLQIKEEVASAYAPYLPDAHSAHHNGQRTAGGTAKRCSCKPIRSWAGRTLEHAPTW